MVDTRLLVVSAFQDGNHFKEAILVLNVIKLHNISMLSSVKCIQILT